MVSLKNNTLEKHCLEFFNDLAYRKIILAYSGGVDSSVLLDCLLKIKNQLKLSLRTVHINHHLNNFSDQYQQHCENITTTKNIQHISLDVYLDNMSNIEEKCRDLRYEKLFMNCKEDEVIVLGHHFDDQIETFLLRMFRGSSIKGMSVMKNISTIDNKILLRPLLNVKKIDILSYAKSNSVPFIDDITNNEEQFDRNFIRKNLLPLIKKRWSSIDKNISNNTLIFSIQNDFLYNQTNQLLKKYSKDNYKRLSVSQVKALNYSTQVMIIHHWVFKLNNTTLNLRQIEEIIKFLDTTNDRNPLFEFNNIRITKDDNWLIIE